MKSLQILIVITGFFSFLVCGYTSAVEPLQVPEFKLANTYSDQLNLTEYLVSEKYDGVRAWWDGRELITRGGLQVLAPAWFTAGFGDQPLDGELWISRGQFEAISSLVRQKLTQPEDWREVKYMVFDLPLEKLEFMERYAKLRALVSSSGSKHLQLVEQHKIESRESLMQDLEEIVALGGEGLMLQRKTAPYHGKRSDDLVKLKPWEDDEATVIGYTPGKGKYHGMTGSLVVETENGLRFRIGSGLSDKLRENPPPIGTVITYKYSGKSRRGVPRFASFLRVRHLQ